MELEKFEQKFEKTEAVFPPEIIEQFKDYIRTEHPVSLDKIPLNTVEDTEILIPARMYLEESQKIANEIMATLRENLERRGEDVSSVEDVKIYPPLSFLENGRLFIFYTNCDASPEAIQKIIQDRKQKGQEIRISFPDAPGKLPKTVGIYRELTLRETQKSLKPGRDEFFRKLKEKRMKEMGIEPDETE